MTYTVTVQRLDGSAAGVSWRVRGVRAAGLLAAVKAATKIYEHLAETVVAAAVKLDGGAVAAADSDLDPGDIYYFTYAAVRNGGPRCWRQTSRPALRRANTAPRPHGRYPAHAAVSGARVPGTRDRLARG